ncbi:sodium:chloride dependent neurotransmitter [Echinococcus multilocularis]|uniref:Sodium:chloride dependent neurotransmitter n=1 Tax=Echinococcus multilocularis TaxID=6211 RepID=A0A068Y386_ECHMU|nr:sodium:chloride dependent neurotransmitter [Echinococcus multilocularis]
MTVKRGIEIESESGGDLAEGELVISDPQDSGVGVEGRGKWKRNIDFLFACAFLIPYFVSVFVTGIPMFFLEVSIGQLMSRGGIEAWEIIPLFKGVGYAGTFILFCLNSYYNVILAWIFFYLFASMQRSVPWSNCGNFWNTKFCVDANSNASSIADSNISLKTDPVNEYWERRVLGISAGIDEIGTVRWELALCLLLAWVTVFLCIFRGIRASGKVLYITATAPFVLMAVLLGRTATLEGAKKGILYYMEPKWEALASFEVWSDAGTQIFFSYSISLGTLTALGGFNDFHHSTVRDTVVFATLNTFTSFLAGCIIFCTLGFMSETSGVPIEDVAESGPGLAFVAYPKALSTMPLSPLWSVLFFAMLFLLGLDSQFVGVEGLVSSVADLFPEVFSSRRPRVLLTIFSSIVCFFVGLLMVTNGGVYIFQLFDYYVGSRIILLVAMFECIVIGFVFGAQRFGKYLNRMYNMRFSYFPSIIYCGVVPWFSLALFVFSVIVYGKLTYKHSYGVYNFPHYSVVLGWLLASCSVACIPTVAFYRLFKAKGSLCQV